MIGWTTDVGWALLSLVLVSLGVPLLVAGVVQLWQLHRSPDGHAPAELVPRLLLDYFGSVVVTTGLTMVIARFSVGGGIAIGMCATALAVTALPHVMRATRHLIEEYT